MLADPHCNHQRVECPRTSNLVTCRALVISSIDLRPSLTSPGWAGAGAGRGHSSGLSLGCRSSWRALGTRTGPAPESGRKAEGDHCRRGTEDRRDDALTGQKPPVPSVGRARRDRNPQWTELQRDACPVKVEPCRVVIDRVKTVLDTKLGAAESYCRIRLKLRLSIAR